MQAFIARYYQAIFLSLMTVVVGVAFYAGFLEGKSDNTQQAVTLSCKENILEKLSIDTKALAAGNDEVKNIATKGKYVGSKNGTKYYTPGCSGALRIKPENYRWFPTAQDAEIQGYTQGSC